jgi:formyl-CoA transferase
MATGYAIAWGVCAALFHRERTGRGQLVQTSLLANALMFQTTSFMSLPAADAAMRENFLNQLKQFRESGESYAEFVRRRRQMMVNAVPGNIYYRGFLTRDGALAVGCLSASLREKMRQALGVKDIRDEPGYNPMDPESIKFGRELAARVEDMMRERSTEEWVARLEKAGVPVSPAYFTMELDTNEQVLANNYVVELDHELSGPQRMAAPPLKMSDSPPAAQGAAPPLGRDNDRILSSLGFSTGEIGAMRTAGTIR